MHMLFAKWSPKEFIFSHCEGYFFINVRYYGSSYHVICFICVVYDIVYKILNTSSQIYYLTINSESFIAIGLKRIFYHNI